MIEVKMNDPAGVILTTAGQKCNQNIKVVPGFDIPEEYDGAYELLVPNVSGVWVFNERPTYAALSTVVVNVTIDGIAFEGFVVETDNESQGYFTIYAGLYSDYTLGRWDASSNSWNKEAYRTWDFGTEPQEVSEEFYAWLTANAVKQ